VKVMAEPDYDYDPADEHEACPACDGEGFYHDCGDDTCCCANPDEDDVYTCHECNGTGHA
jgi:hypothetical protein